ncbi:MAG: TonB-dependent receptor plug domain-containing protein, partial [Gemmatimonadota bacterium]
ATSINASGRSQEPLIVVDGVILGRGMGIADLNSLDIKNIEVVKGAAAASLYGSRAANGVVQITTQRGENLDQGDVNFTLRTEVGRGQLPKKLDLANFTSLRTNPQGCPDNCYLDSNGNPTDFGGAALDFEEGFPNQNTWTVFQDNQWPESQLYDQVGRFFDPGDDYTLYGGEYYDKKGIVRFENGYQRKNVRLNLDNSPTEDLNFQVSGFYSDAVQDDVDNTAFFNITFMPPNVNLLEKDEDGDLVILPDPKSLEANPLYQTKNLENNEFRQRVMGSARATWDPTSWLTLEGNFSYDRSGETFRYYEFKGFKEADAPEGTDGEMSMDTDVQEALNAKFLATYSNTFGDLTTRLKGQVLVERQHDEGFSADATNFAVKGTPTLNALTGRPNIDSYERDIRSESYYLISSLDYKGRYILDGLVRRDGSSLFGDERRWHTYYRGSAAWRVSQEPWWPAQDAIGEFKLRGSYGTAGSRPRFNAQYETYSITGQGGVVPQSLGNKELEPEFSKEMELGANMVLFDRVSLDLTYAESDVEDQILQVPLPGYFGFDSQWRNAGALHSETWEASLQTQVLSTDDMNWSLNATFSTTDQKITELDVPPYQWGPKNAFYNREGEVLGTMYGTRWATSCDDLPEGTPCGPFDVNDDGYLVWVGQGNSWKDGFEKKLWGTSGTVNGNSYTWGEPIPAVNDEGESFLPLGNTNPDANVSLGNNISWKGLSVYGLFDAAIGQEVYNQTIQWAYRERRHGAVDQHG